MTKVQFTPELMATSLNQSDGDHGFQIAPMVDVVFVLLLFFMALSGLKQTEKYLPAALPGPAIENITLLPPAVVEIAADGTVAVNGEFFASSEDMALAQLRAHLQRVGSEDAAHVPVVFRTNENAEHGRFVQVLALVNKLGFKKISFS